MHDSPVLEFLSLTEPFSRLSHQILTEIEGMSQERSYKKGHVILEQGGPPGDYLWIIRNGRVKVFVRSVKGEDVVIDYRGAGECFGFVSLLGGERARSYVTAVEDTSCILIPREVTIRLMERFQVVSDFVHTSLLCRLIDKAYAEISRRSPVQGVDERLLFNVPLRDIVDKEPISASPDITIRQAASIMSDRSVGSLVLIDDQGRPSGIVTDKDLRNKVISKGVGLHEPVRSIMSTELIRSETSDLCFDAVLKMIRHRIHHLLVFEQGALKGIVTNHDLMMLQGTSPLSISREIDDQQTVEGLVSVSRKIVNIIGLLLKEGVRAGNITRVISEINDRLFIRLLEISEQLAGPAPVRYSWIVFGSEGRKEQTFRTDQDNALIYEDCADPVLSRRADEYFANLSALVTGHLAACGIPPCPAGYMAANPIWRQPISVWKRYFSEWISEPNGEALLRSLILFDFRHLYGDQALAGELRDALSSLLNQTQSFLGFMANTITKNIPPSRFFSSSSIWGRSANKATIDLKVKGLGPLIDIVRFFSLEKDIRQTSTLERIQALQDTHTTVNEYAEQMQDAFEFIMRLRMRHQYEQITAGIEADNKVRIAVFSALERKRLKEAFRMISGLQESIIQRYKAFMY